MRQSLNRRKPTRCRLNYKKQKKVVLYYKVISEQKSAPLTLSLIKCNPAKSVAILRQKNLSRIICRGEQRSPVLRICCKFRIVGENFLLPNLIVAVGLLLRRANTVRPCSGFAVNSELSGEFFAAEPCCYRRFVSSTGERCSPLHIHRADTAG